MWELLRKVMKPILDLILWAETAFKGKTGAEKLEIVVDKASGLINIPFVPDAIETPIKKAALKYIVEFLVDKLNWFT